MRPMDLIHSSQLRKKKVPITDEAAKRQENLKEKASLLEVEFLKKEQQNQHKNLNKLQLPTELQFKKLLDELHIAKNHKEKALKGLFLHKSAYEDSFLLSRPVSQQKEDSIAVFNQQRFSSSYAKFLSVTNNSYMSYRNEQNPGDLSAKIESLAADYKKVLSIIDMEKANEVTIRNRINEISKSSIQINKEITRVRKNINEIEHRFKNVELLEMIAEKKKGLAYLNFQTIREDFEKMASNDNEMLNSVKNINDREELHLKEEKDEFSKLLVEIEEKKALKRKLSSDIQNLDKEIFEKQLKKKDSKFIVSYTEVFLQLSHLFLDSGTQNEELQELYENFQTSNSYTQQDAGINDKSRKNSPRKRVKTQTKEESFYSKDEIHEENQFIERNVLLLKLDEFYAKYNDGPMLIADKLVNIFQVLHVQMDSLQRMYDELLLSKNSKKGELKLLNDNLLDILTKNTHLLPDAFLKNSEEINLRQITKSGSFHKIDEKRQSSNSFPKTLATEETSIFTPRDGNTINLLLNQIDASKFNWRKKDLALIQNFIFKCFLSLTESLYRATILIELFMQKINDFEIDNELESFFESFLEKMGEYRKGFLLKRKENINNFANEFEINNEFSLNSPLAMEKTGRNLFDFNENNVAPATDRKKYKGLLLKTQDSIPNNMNNTINNSINVSQNKGFGTNVNSVFLNNNQNNNNNNNNNANFNNNLHMTLKNIEILNELELYVPLGVTELIEIFYSVFHQKDLQDIAEEWAYSIKKDKTTSHFHSKESLTKYLNQIKINYSHENIKTQASKTLENLIILKEQALEIQMQKIKNMMELYGEFVSLFNKKLWEKGFRKPISHKRVVSKENASDFVKKTFKEKCTSLINRKLDVDSKEEQNIEGIKEKNESQKKNEGKKRDSHQNMDIADIKKNIDELCSKSFVKKNKEIEKISVKEKEKNGGKTNSLVNKIPNQQKQNLNKNLAGDNNKIKSSLKKTTSLLVRNESEKIFEEEDSVEIERKNFKLENERLEFERTHPIVTKKKHTFEGHEKYEIHPNEDFQKIIENQKFMHKLLNLQNRNSPLEMKPFIYKSNFTPNHITPRKFSLSQVQKNSYDIKINNDAIADFKPTKESVFSSQSTKHQKTQKQLKSQLQPLTTSQKFAKTKFFKARKFEPELDNEENNNFINDSNPPRNNKSINNLRISYKNKTITRKVATSMSSRNTNFVKKKLANDNKNNLVSIPYLNYNQYSVLGIKGKDLIHWDFGSNSNMNVFNTPGIYTSLPFLMENKEHSTYMSRNLLVDLMK